MTQLGAFGDGGRSLAGLGEAQVRRASRRPEYRREPRPDRADDCAEPLTGLAPGAYVAVIQAGAAGAVASSEPIAFEVLGPCQSRRVVALHLHAAKGGYRAIAATLGGKKLALRGGKRAPTVRIDLRGRGKGAYTVRIVGTTASGRHVRATRTFRTCGRALR